MKRIHPIPRALEQAAKLAIATLPALTILLAAAIALGAQPTPATAPKRLVGRDRNPAVIWPALGAGDFIEDRSERFQKVSWPALGAGDFELATQAPSR